MATQKYFAARADSFGATILNRHGGKGNYSWNMTNTTYSKGQLFYVYEIIDGWCRVHGLSDNYWVWHERLKLQKYIKLRGIILVPRHYTRVVTMATLFFIV